MGLLAFWRKDFTVQFTFDGFKRLLRLAKRLEQDEDDFASTLQRAMALYAHVASWKNNPLFRLAADGDHVPCRLKDCVVGPCGPYAYELDFCCSWREWVIIRRVLSESGDPDLSVTVGRALELLELKLDGRLPQLYAIDRRGEFEQVELPSATSLV